MTDIQPAPITLDAIGPVPEHNGGTIWLPQLNMETRRAGLVNIEGRTFVDCLIEGPAVMLPLSGCHFDGCDLGDAHGDPSNLLLKPVGAERVTGAIPVVDCKFIRCRFWGVGFTGRQGFLDQMLSVLGASVR